MIDQWQSANVSTGTDAMQGSKRTLIRLGPAAYCGPVEAGQPRAVLGACARDVNGPLLASPLLQALKCLQSTLVLLKDESCGYDQVRERARARARVCWEGSNLA